MSISKNDKFWPDEVTIQHNFRFTTEWRSQLAWELIKTHPNIAGIEAGEDSTGRSRLKLQTPSELVARSFEIADIFAATAIERGDIAPVAISREDQAKENGRLDSIREEERYHFMREAKK